MQQQRITLTSTVVPPPKPPRLHQQSKVASPSTIKPIKTKPTTTNPTTIITTPITSLSMPAESQQKRRPKKVLHFQSPLSTPTVTTTDLPNVYNDVEHDPLVAGVTRATTTTAPTITTGDMSSDRPKQKTSIIRRSAKTRKTSTPAPAEALVTSRLTHGCSTLMHACQQGDVAAVLEQLRTQPERIRQRDSRNKSVLHYCAVQQERELVAAASIAVAAPELLGSADEDGFTPLHLAVIQGNLAMVNLLLANKADVNAVDNEGHSVVHWATVCGEVEALRSVLAAGANVTTPDINGGSPLHYAAQMCGANYEGKSGSAASSKLAMDTLGILLGHPQSSVDLQDKDGRQPILWAASAGSAKAVIALVKEGARVESADKDGLTALHCAASRGHTECIDTLISLCGAPTDLIDANGCTALHYAVTLGHADATSRLLELEADPNRQDRKGRTPAHCGCSKGQFETVKLLKEHGANLWLRNAKGDLPVHEAASSGRRELVEWLLEQRPKQVNTTSNDGRSLMHIAAVNDYTDMCKMLLDYGADVNAIYRNSKGAVITPLDCALQKAHRSTAKFMQANGGLPASKLRLAARRSNPFQEASCDVVRPLKYAEKEEIHDLRNSKKYVVYLKRSDSDGGEASCSCNEQTYHKEQRYSHVCRRHQRSRRYSRRRTSSCGEPKSVKQIQRGDSGSDICRSKSNIELRCRKSRGQNASSSEDDDEDSCENCCYHKREKRRVIKRRSTSNARRLRELKDSDGNSQKRTEERKPQSGERKSKSEQQTSAEGAKPPCSSSVTSKPAGSSRPLSAPSTKRRTPPPSAAKDGALTEMSPQQAAESSDSVTSRAASTPEKEPMTDDDDVEANQSEVVHVVVHRDADDGQSTASLKLSDDAELHPEEKLEDAATLETNKMDSNMQQDAGVSQVGEVIEGVTKEVDQLLQTAAAIVDNNAAAKTEDETKKEGSVSEPLLTTDETEEAKDDKNDDTEMVSINNNVEHTEEAQKLDDKSTLTTLGAPPKLIQTPATPRSATPPTPVATATALATPLQTTISATNTAPDSSAEVTTELPAQTQLKESKSLEEKSEEPTASEKGGEEVATAAPTNSTASEDQSPVAPVLPTTASTYTTESVSPAPVGASAAATFSEAKNQQREQESRRSFTLLPSDSADEEQPIRKSSFQVLNSDESLDLDAANAPADVEDVGHDVEFSGTQVFQIVSRGHSSQDEEEYEEEEPQVSTVVDDDKIYEDDSSLRRYTSSGNRHGVSNVAATEFEYASGRRRRLKKRIRSGTKSRSNWQSSIEEHAKTAPRPQQISSKDQDSGFEPSPRATKSKIPTLRSIYTAQIARRPIYATLDGRSCSSRVENRKPGDKGACDMTSVTRSIQRNIRRYYMERKIFQHLLELKSLQIRSNKLNEAVLVKRTVDDYHKSCAALSGETGGRMRRYPYTEYTFKNFELFLYDTLKALQKPGTCNFQNINEVYEEAERRLSPDYNAYEKAMQCTSKTHRCLHAAHAYTGIPCAAYIPMMNHHTMPKFGFGPYKKTGVGSFYLPKILTGNSSCGGKVSLEFSHGRSKQLIPLPSEKLDSNKRYYVTFTVKESQSGEKQQPHQQQPLGAAAEAAAKVYGERK